jgi:hypothetical protein
MPYQIHHDRLGRRRCYLNGKRVSLRRLRRRYPKAGQEEFISRGGWKPLHSDALAVHPDQIPEAVALAKRRGVPTDFDGEGRPIFTSRHHRRQYSVAHGFYDRDAGYSDAQRGSFKGDICGSQESLKDQY